MHQRHHCLHAARAAGDPPSFRLAGDEPRWSRTRAFSLDDLALELALDLDARAVGGEAILTLRRVDPEARWGELDAIDFAIASVEREHDGEWREAPHEYDGEVLRVDLADLADGASTRVRVAYRASPRRGLYFTAPDEARPDRECLPLVAQALAGTALTGRKEDGPEHTVATTPAEGAALRKPVANWRALIEARLSDVDLKTKQMRMPYSEAKK